MGPLWCFRLAKALFHCFAAFTETAVRTAGRELRAGAQDGEERDGGGGSAAHYGVDDDGGGRALAEAHLRPLDVQPEDRWKCPVLSAGRGAGAAGVQPEDRRA